MQRIIFILLLAVIITGCQKKLQAPGAMQQNSEGGTMPQEQKTASGLGYIIEKEKKGPDRCRNGVRPSRSTTPAG